MGTDFPSASYDQWKLAPPNEADEAMVDLTDHADEVLDTVTTLLEGCRTATNESDLENLYDRLTQARETIGWLMSDVAKHL